MKFIEIPSLRKMLRGLRSAQFALVLAACNTTQGIGEDVEAAGDAIGDQAEEERRD